MHSSYTFTVGSAVFDERNLVSAAGLVPVLELAEQTGLSGLIGEHVELPSTRVRSGAVNPAGKLTSIVAGHDVRTASMMSMCCALAARRGCSTRCMRRRRWASSCASAPSALRSW